MGEVYRPDALRTKDSSNHAAEINASSACGVPPSTSIDAVSAASSSASVDLPSDWTLSDRDLCDLEMLLSGAFAPLKGYHSREDYLSVLNEMRLTTGEVWPIPIVLAIPKSATSPNVHWMQRSGEGTAGTGTAAGAAGSSGVAGKAEKRILRLRDHVGSIVAEVVVEDVYEPDLELERLKVLGSTDMNHPYAQHLMSHHSNCYYIGGEVTRKALIEHFDFQECRMTCEAVRAFIKEKGWEVVVGFQTQIGRAHV